MTPKLHTHAGLTAALAVAAVLAASAPAPAMSIDSDSSHQATEAALAQEAYYSSFRPSLSSQTGSDLRTVDARDAAGVPDGAVTRVTAPAPPAHADTNGFEWDDAAVGAASALGLMLVLAGGAAAISRRHRPVTS